VCCVDSLRSAFEDEFLVDFDHYFILFRSLTPFDHIKGDVGCFRRLGELSSRTCRVADCGHHIQASHAGQIVPWKCSVAQERSELAERSSCAVKACPSLRGRRDS
jgi:hypothetical protein